MQGKREREWKKTENNEEEDKDEDEEEVEDREMEIEASWQSFVTARMVMMSMALDKLLVKNEGLRQEIREM